MPHVSPAALSRQDPLCMGTQEGACLEFCTKRYGRGKATPPPITRRVPHRIQARVHPAHLLFGCSVGEGCRCRDRSCLTDAWHDVGGVANILEGVDSVENYLEAA